VTHSIADILRARMLAIACGYEDADGRCQVGRSGRAMAACRA